MTLQAPSERYKATLAAHDYTADPAQLRALESLDRVWRELIANARPGLLNRLKAKLSGEPVERTPVRGLYMWGGVGRGKTFLMDQFFHALPFDQKTRLHFHRFMQQVHGELKQLKAAQDPLKTVAARIARETRVICFDEFFVSDIADAMILGRLFENLFRYGVTLVATSNILPDELYRNGLQRARFLPAIRLVKQHCEILNVDGGTDYRLRTLEQVEIYHHPLDEESEQAMLRYFLELNPDGHEVATSLEINGREIPARKVGEGVAWFDFSQLCEGPRSASDYIEIAREYHTVLLSNVPCMDWTRENEARRFITLVDELYDRNVKLIISAATRPQFLYKGRRLNFEFQRTFSRLTDMRSEAYLVLPHLP